MPDLHVPIDELYIRTSLMSDIDKIIIDALEIGLAKVLHNLLKKNVVINYGYLETKDISCDLLYPKNSDTCSLGTVKIPKNFKDLDILYNKEGNTYTFTYAIYDIF